MWVWKGGGVQQKHSTPMRSSVLYFGIGPRALLPAPLLNSYATPPPTPTGPRPPAGDARQSTLRYAVFSCSNWGWGYFNAYAAAAKYALDFWIHLGEEDTAQGRSLPHGTPPPLPPDLVNLVAHSGTQRATAACTHTVQRASKTPVPWSLVGNQAEGTGSVNLVDLI